ncbi:hypothetical protein GGF44_001319 [Coemansia sp. RSA 1694]|nr:hypothetical protein GGF44_001319 [Coemansia sp. RSA 1694]
MDILLASQDRGSQHIEKLQAAYRRHRRLYQKHTKLASKAAEAMHLATRMLVRALNTQPGSTSEAHDVAGRPPAKERLAPIPLRGADERSYLSNDDSNRSANSLSEICVMRGTLSHTNRPAVSAARKATVSVSPTIRCSASPSAEGALMSSDCAVRAYQFSTLRQKAFQLKPRAAFACSIGSESEQKIVAYGLDGTVQVWNPHTQISEVALVRDDLGIEHVEDMTQLNSHILAGVPKVANGDSCTTSLPSVVFIGLGPLLPSIQPGASIKTQRWMQSPHEGQISVILGMPRLRQGHSSKAFLLTGGTRDKEVYLWSVETNDAHVTKMLATRKMYAGHTSRITALCHEPVGNNAISGSASGRISVNDMESGKLIATSGQPSQLTIGSTVLCPTNTNILMTTCVSRREQVRIFDLRKGISWAKPAIVLGIDTPRTQSRYSRPAWHPDGGLVVYPYRGGTSAAPNDGTVAIWDTRYARCNEETPQLFNPHREAVWSVCFVEARDSGKPTMVTASGDHTIGFSAFNIIKRKN